MVKWLFLAVSRGCLRFVIVVFPDHTHLLFSMVPMFKAVYKINKFWYEIFSIIFCLSLENNS